MTKDEKAFEQAVLAAKDWARLHDKDIPAAAMIKQAIKAFTEAKPYPAPITDSMGSRLWLHRSCMNTQWYPSGVEEISTKEWSYCYSCFMTTGDWTPLFGECPDPEHKGMACGEFIGDEGQRCTLPKEHNGGCA